MKVDLDMELRRVESKETVDGEVGFERELEGCRNKCKELEERSKKAEESFLFLELEIEKRKQEFEWLKGKFRALEVERIVIEDEVKILNRRNVELKEQITRVGNENKVGGEAEKGRGKVVDLTKEKNEEDKIVQLMIENKVLESEKKRAESEVEVWTLKCTELESRVLVLEKENLVLRGGQSPLARMVKSQPEMHKKQITKASDLNDGLDLATSLEKLETNCKMVDDNETIHSAIGISSTCYSPLKESGDLQAEGTHLIGMSSKQSTQIEGSMRDIPIEIEIDYGSGVRKQSAFGEEGSLSQKKASLTPDSARPSFGIIDRNDELANTNVHMPISESQVDSMGRVSADFPSGDAGGNENKKTSADNFKGTLLDHSDVEDMNGYKGTSPFISTPKRKRASNIVTSDSENDDNVPMSKLKTKHPHELNNDTGDSHLNVLSVTATVSEDNVRESATPRRRLVTLRQLNAQGVPEQYFPSNYHYGKPTNEGVENDEMEKDGSESEDESEGLGGFIINSSNMSDGDDGPCASEGVSDCSVDFDEVLSTIRRNRDHKLKWEFEADMLAAFGKDPELCMEAVCALYRQQTSEEKFWKGTLYSNQRGFSQSDALRGTTLAEFLTDGDPEGGLKKSVEELQEYNPNGPELCRTMATHYSKQLFAIYKNKEDPLFLPS